MKQLATQNICIYHEDYPSTLDKNELLDPYRVIDGFFRTYSLLQAKQYLWEAMKFNLVDINTPTVEMRPLYYRFLLNLEKVVDAAWMLKEYNHFQSVNGSDVLSKEVLKRWRDDDLLSFLTPYESANPKKVITDFFSYQSLCRWKISYLDNLRKTILEPMYFLLFGNDTLEEFVKFTKFSKLLEGLFLMRVPKEYVSNCATPLAAKKWNDCPHIHTNGWLKEYATQNESFTSVQHFANICYAHRFHHEWNNYNVHKIFESYEIVLKITHSIIQILSKYPVNELPNDVQKIVKKHKIWPAGRITRFVSGLLLTSRTFSKGYQPYTPPQNEMDYITRLIYLAYEIPRI